MHLVLFSDFVENSYGESRGSSCEKIQSPSPEPTSPSSKNNESSLENSWAIVYKNQTVNLKADSENSI